jgi:hypothetical protein
MRPIWFVTALFLLLGIVGVCRSPDAPPASGCTRLAGGLEHCPNTPLSQ